VSGAIESSATLIARRARWFAGDDFGTLDA
jgi:hypothetical protein